MKRPPTLHTERLILRPFDVSDAADIQRLVGDWAIADTTLTMPHPYEDGMAEAWIATHQPGFEAGESVHLAVVLRETGQLVGAMGLVLRAQFRRAELGYWIGRPYWNQGYATEAARAVVDYAFSVLGLNRVHAGHFTRNPASGRVMQKLGMVHEGRARQHVVRWDVFEDLELYGVLREEWGVGSGGGERGRGEGEERDDE